MDDKEVNKFYKTYQVFRSSTKNLNSRDSCKQPQPYFTIQKFFPNKNDNIDKEKEINIKGKINYFNLKKNFRNTIQLKEET